jgi:hypothetical protein
MIRVAAMVGRAGYGAEFLAARDPDDIAILLAIGEAGRDEREREAKDAAHFIAEGTRKVLGG